MEGIFRVLVRPRGTEGVVSNTGLVVSEMDESNLQVMIYYIKNSKRIGRTCTDVDVDLAKVRAIYHQWYM